jgi:hypothetical protein
MRDESARALADLDGAPRIHRFGAVFAARLALTVRGPSKEANDEALEAVHRAARWGLVLEQLPSLGRVRLRYEDSDTLRLQSEVDSAGIVSRHGGPQAVVLEHADDQLSFLPAANYCRDDRHGSSVAERSLQLSA